MVCVPIVQRAGAGLCPISVGTRNNRRQTPSLRLMTVERRLLRADTTRDNAQVGADGAAGPGWSLRAITNVACAT
eukprot:5454735-Prymnesium_polylepis.1